MSARPLQELGKANAVERTIYPKVAPNHALSGCLIITFHFRALLVYLVL